MFLDRDGVLIRDVHLLTRRDQVQLAPGAAEAVQALRGAGFAIIVVTNQTVVARGLSSKQEVEEIHRWIQRLLVAGGAEPVDRYYFCPHHPSATLAAYRQQCTCRKPSPGMLLQAATEVGIDLGSSWMIGDRVSDIVAGYRAGCRTVLVETGMHAELAIESGDGQSANVSPDYKCADFQAAATTILGIDA